MFTISSPTSRLNLELEIHESTLFQFVWPGRSRLAEIEFLTTTPLWLCVRLTKTMCYTSIPFSNQSLRAVQVFVSPTISTPVLCFSSFATSELLGKCLNYLRCNLVCCSLRGTDVTPTPTSDQESLTTEKSMGGSVSLKVETTLSEIEVLIRVSEKNLAEVKIRGT